MANRKINFRRRRFYTHTYARVWAKICIWFCPAHRISPFPKKEKWAESNVYILIVALEMHAINFYISHLSTHSHIVEWQTYEPLLNVDLKSLALSWHLVRTDAHTHIERKQCHHWRPYQLASVYNNVCYSGTAEAFLSSASTKIDSIDFFLNDFWFFLCSFFTWLVYVSVCVRFLIHSVPLLFCCSSNPNVWFQFKMIRIYFMGKRQMCMPFLYVSVYNAIIYDRFVYILSICRWRWFGAMGRMKNARKRDPNKEKETKNPSAIV